MPLVRISVLETMAPDRRRVLPQVVYDAMRTAISIPENDLFVILTKHAEGELVFDPTYLGMHRDSDFMAVHITLRKGRSTEAKQALYREIAKLAQERASINPNNILIVLSENDMADWSFGRGEAQYVLNPPAPPKPAGDAS